MCTILDLLANWAFNKVPFIVLVRSLCCASIVEVLALEFQALKLLHDYAVWLVELDGPAVVRALLLFHV